MKTKDALLILKVHIIVFKYTGKIVASAVGTIHNMVHKQARNFESNLHEQSGTHGCGMTLIKIIALKVHKCTLLPFSSIPYY